MKNPYFINLAMRTADADAKNDSLKVALSLFFLYNSQLFDLSSWTNYSLEIYLIFEIFQLELDQAN